MLGGAQHPCQKPGTPLAGPTSQHQSRHPQLRKALRHCHLNGKANRDWCETCVFLNSAEGKLPSVEGRLAPLLDRGGLKFSKQAPLRTDTRWSTPSLNPTSGAGSGGGVVKASTRDSCAFLQPTPTTYSS